MISVVQPVVQDTSLSYSFLSLIQIHITHIKRLVNVSLSTQLPCHIFPSQHATPCPFSSSHARQRIQHFLSSRGQPPTGTNSSYSPKPSFPLSPSGVQCEPPLTNHDLFARMVSEPVHADSEEVDVLRSAAKRVGVIVSVDHSEKVRTSIVSVYNSNLVIESDACLFITANLCLRSLRSSLGRLGMVMDCESSRRPLERWEISFAGVILTSLRRMIDGCTRHIKSILYA